MEECAFCKIIRGESESHLIFESDTLICILDIDPIHKGHVLIIPKIHRSSIDEIPILVLHEMMQLTQKIAHALKHVYNADGYSMMQNGGDFCDFGHFHLHIFPRYKQDGFGWTYPKGPFECSSDVANEIREHLSIFGKEINEVV